MAAVFTPVDAADPDSPKVAQVPVEEGRLITAGRDRPRRTLISATR
jgi:hypothetical protein